jgi:Na+/glutamate symporter
MDSETINLIKALFEEYANKDSSTVTAAYITIGGMLGVAILGAISQWIITKRVVSEEHRRMRAQVVSEQFARQHEKWEDDIIEGITGLLKATDPEINSECSTG